MDSEERLRTWNTYQSAWGPIGEAERRALLERSVADDILYTDPASQTKGVDDLVGRIATSQTQFAGAYFRNDNFLEHHDQGLFHWSMYDASDNLIVKGTSFGRFGEDGRLVQATGFFKAPEAD